MFTRRHLKNICIIIAVSVMLLGVCPTGVGADSFFVFDSHTSDMFEYIGNTNKFQTIAYTGEVMPQREAMFSPSTTIRRLSMRHGGRDCFTGFYDYYSSFFFSKVSHSFSQHFLDEIFSNTVIIHFIHHQDGEKV